MKAVWNEVVIAESDATVVVEGNHYFPPDSVKREYLRDSNKAVDLSVEGEGELLRRRGRRPSERRFGMVPSRSETSRGGN
jgi:hypothetical protein